MSINMKTLGLCTGIAALVAAALLNSVFINASDPVFALPFLMIAGSALIVIGLADRIRGVIANLAVTIGLIVAGLILTLTAGPSPSFLAPIAMAATITGAFFTFRWLLVFA